MSLWLVWRIWCKKKKCSFSLVWYAFHDKIKYIDFVYRNSWELSFGEIFAAHHRQGISLSADLKSWIDFEKTCGTDRFCKSITRKQPSRISTWLFQWVAFCGDTPLQFPLAFFSGVCYNEEERSRIPKEPGHATKRKDQLWNRACAVLRSSRLPFWCSCPPVLSSVRRMRPPTMNIP